MVVFLGLTGEIGAGKDTFAEIAAAKYPAVSLTLSEILVEEALKRNLPIVRENLRLIAEEIGKTFGPKGLAEISARMLLSRLRESECQLGLIPGVRTVSQIQGLKETLPNFKLVAVTAPFELRFDRIKNIRMREDEKNLTMEEFRIIDEREMHSDNDINPNVGEVIKLADFTIANDSTIEAFETASLNLISYLKAQDVC